MNRTNFEVNGVGWMAILAILGVFAAAPASAQMVLTTTYAGGNGQDGIMFDVVATKAVDLTGFDISTTAGSSVEVFDHLGTYVGTQDTASDFTLQGTYVTTATGGPGTHFNLTSPIIIGAGQTLALYLTTGSVNYTNGTASFTDGNLTINSGEGKAYISDTNFGGTNFTPREFNGAIYYLLALMGFSPSEFSLSGLTPNQQGVLGPINNGLFNNYTSSNFSSLLAALTPLTADPADFGRALDQLSPQEFGQFTSATAFNNASFETEAMDNYLDGRRVGSNGTFLGGNGHVDASGLTMNDPSYDPSLAMVHSRLLAWSPSPVNGEISDVANPVLGGVDMKDAKSMQTAEAPAYTDPWNFFVRGNVILAQGFSQNDVAHFDDNTESVVLGTDYRVTPNFLIGLTAGYGHTDVTLDDNGSSATVDSYSPGLYASYADKGWYANVSGNYTHDAYTQSRVIGFIGQTANSAPEGNQGTANLDGGYDFHHGDLTFGPLAGVEYTHLSVDGYNESGSIADLNVNEQDSDSLRSRLGGRISYAFSHYGINFSPHLDASWQHECLDQSRGITSQFEGAGLGSFSVRTTNPSRDSALADIGLDADLNRMVGIFTDYEVQAGQENYFGQSVRGWGESGILGAGGDWQGGAFCR
jgi:uncharacterized protein YhjY with autotransporter beta-barrel domain